jgi:hypothetical protein
MAAVDTVLSTDAEMFGLSISLPPSLLLRTALLNIEETEAVKDVVRREVALRMAARKDFTLPHSSESDMKLRLVRRHVDDRG